MQIIGPVCNLDVKHLLHVFFDCEYVKQYWFKTGVVFDISEVE